jgi:hypothetical protein
VEAVVAGRIADALSSTGKAYSITCRAMAKRSGNTSTEGKTVISATLQVTHEGVSGIELRRGQFDVTIDGKTVGRVENHATMATHLCAPLAATRRGAN